MYEELITALEKGIQDATAEATRLAGIATSAQNQAAEALSNSSVLLGKANGFRETLEVIKQLRDKRQEEDAEATRVVAAKINEATGE